MWTMISLFLVAATIGTPVVAQSPSLITISTSVSSLDGSLTGGKAHDSISTTPTTWYVTTGENLCLIRSARRERPADAGFGWSVELTQTAVTGESVSITAKWRRLWEDGKATQGAPQRTALLTLHPGVSITLDSLSSIGAGQAPQPNPCTALNMSLQIGMEPIPSTHVISAELWLVHTDTAGRETTQRQVVRSSGEKAEYFFDPESLTTPSGPIKSLISGTLTSFIYRDGRLLGKLKIARETPGNPGGSSTYAISVAPGEVVSFPLGSTQSPATASDRLAVRLRLGFLVREP